MHTFLLSIGSNTYAKANIRKAKIVLTANFPDIVFTKTITTNAYGKTYKRPFANLLAVISHPAEADELNVELKAIEKEMGRKSTDKEKGRAIIDIDLIKCDETILRPKDFERDYVQELLQYVE